VWPETLAAIKAVAVASDTHVLNGKQWNRHVIAREFRDLCKECEVYRAGITEPYSLRRTFETVAKNADVNQSIIDRITESRIVAGSICFSSKSAMRSRAATKRPSFSGDIPS
jgi:hypothetical protein